jgi:hypothetical protein
MGTESGDGFIPLLDDWALPELAGLSDEWVYRFSIELKSTQRVQNAAVLSIRFYDEEGLEIGSPYAGWKESQRFSAYRYVDTVGGPVSNTFSLTFVPPSSAKKAFLTLHSWACNDLRFVGPIVERYCQSPSSQRHTSELLVQRLLQDWALSTVPLIVLSTTTKPIGERHRANRPMQLALEYADQGVFVIYAYYRFDEHERLPETKRPNLVQVPNDHYHGIASTIAFAPGSGRKYLISSIPDNHAVHELCLFQSAGWRTLYEARDDWEEFKNEGVGGWYSPLFESFLAIHADAVTAVSPPLLKKQQVFGASPEKCKVIPNGAGIVFQEAGAAERSSRRMRGPTAVVGYFGHLTDKWFDWNLVLSAARERPDYEFQIIGFDAPRELDPPENVILHDARPQDELIRMARSWEVGLVPFKPSILARGVDPIKCHEYLAIGLKCLSVHMPQIEQYPATRTYRDRSEFLSELDRAMEWVLSEDDWQSIERHVAEATWRNRADATLKVLDGRSAR